MSAPAQLVSSRRSRFFSGPLAWSSSGPAQLRNRSRSRLWQWTLACSLRTSAGPAPLGEMPCEWMRKGSIRTTRSPTSTHRSEAAKRSAAERSSVRSPHVAWTAPGTSASHSLVRGAASLVLGRTRRPSSPRDGDRRHPSRRNRVGLGVWLGCILPRPVNL